MQWFSLVVRQLELFVEKGEELVRGKAREKGKGKKRKKKRKEKKKKKKKKKTKEKPVGGKLFPSITQQSPAAKILFLPPTLKYSSTFSLPLSFSKGNWERRGTEVFPRGDIYIYIYIYICGKRNRRLRKEGGMSLMNE